MDTILHQLRLVVKPIIYKVLYMPGGAGFLVTLGPPYNPHLQAINLGHLEGVQENSILGELAITMVLHSGKLT